MKTFLKISTVYISHHVYSGSSFVSVVCVACKKTHGKTKEDGCFVLEKKNTYMQGTKIEEGKEKERQKTGEEEKKRKRLTDEYKDEFSTHECISAS